MIVIELERHRSPPSCKYFHRIRSPPDHSWLRLANHILYEPSRAIRPRDARSLFLTLILSMLHSVSSTTWLQADLQGQVEAGETPVPQVPSQPLVPGRLSIKSRFEVGVRVPGDGKELEKIHGISTRNHRPWLSACV